MGVPIDPQGLLETRDEEQQANTRTCDNITQAIESVVSGPVGESEGPIVEHQGKTGLITAGADIALTIR